MMQWRRGTSCSLVSADRGFLGVALRAGSETERCVVRVPARFGRSVKARRLDRKVRPDVDLLAVAALAMRAALDPVSHLAGWLAAPMREVAALW
jgi:hypothetical protein